MTGAAQEPAAQERTAQEPAAQPNGMPVSVAPPDAPASVASSRYDGVQALRFVAALMVVVTHATFYTRERLDPGLPVWQAGTAGVDVFFVISGFVIVIASRRLIGRRDGAREFAVRRVIRIVPLYWAATTLNLAVLLVLPGAVLHSTLDWWNIGSSYLFLPSYNVDGKIEPLLGVGWTLTFEMFFYAVFAFALLIRRNVYVVVGVVMVACALGSIWRQPDWPAAAFYLSPRVLEFYFGMLLAAWAARWSLPRAVAIAAVVAGLAALLVGPLFLPELPLLLGKGVPALLLVAGVVSLEPVLGPRIPRWVIFLGAASYAIYLFHPMIAPIVPSVVERLGWSSTVLSVVGAVVVAVAAASAVHVLFERPVIQRLTARRRGPGTRPQEAAP